MTIILDQCNKAARAEIALGSSYEDNLEAGELIKFLARVPIVCNGTNNANILFGCWVTKMTEHHFQPTPIVEELISVYPTGDVIWDNNNQWDVSFDIVDDAETTTNIHITNKSTYDCHKLDSQDPVTVTTSMSHNNDKPWFDAYEDFDLWYDTSEAMNDYNEW